MNIGRDLFAVSPWFWALVLSDALRFMVQALDLYAILGAHSRRRCVQVFPFLFDRHHTTQRCRIGGLGSHRDHWGDSPIPNYGCEGTQHDCTPSGRNCAFGRLERRQVLPFR